MTQVVVSDLASNDQAEILRYLAMNAGPGRPGSTTIGSPVCSIFRSTFAASARHAPGCLGARIRIGIVLPYVVIYRYSAGDDTVTILRIVHGRRNITRGLLRG